MLWVWVYLLYNTHINTLLGSLIHETASEYICQTINMACIISKGLCVYLSTHYSNHRHQLFTNYLWLKLLVWWINQTYCTVRSHRLWITKWKIRSVARWLAESTEKTLEKFNLPTFLEEKHFSEIFIYYEAICARG